MLLSNYYSFEAFLKNARDLLCFHVPCHALFNRISKFNRMKQFLETLCQKATELLDRDTSTRDRPPVFRVTVVTLVAANIFLILLYAIKNFG
jgi:hypothetical protein